STKIANASTNKCYAKAKAQKLQMQMLCESKSTNNKKAQAIESTEERCRMKNFIRWVKWTREV
ncbi:MAG: hypothetical protein RRY78_06650, partial [Clostridia bacterium]